MAGLPKNFARGVAGTADTTVTVPASKRWIITNIVATSSATGTVSVTITLDGIPIVNLAQLGANGIMTLDCAQVLETGKTIKYKASAATSINVHISGVEMDA